MTTLTPEHLPLLHEHMRNYYGRPFMATINGRTAIRLCIGDVPNADTFYPKDHPCHALLTSLANVEPRGRWSRNLLRLAAAWDRDREARAADETKTAEIIADIKTIALKTKSPNQNG